MFTTTHLHPMLVHFPIALLMLGFLAAVLALIYKKETCFSVAAFYILVLSALAALAAYLTGVFFTSEMSGAADEIKEVHELFASITFYSVLVNAALSIFLKIRKNENKTLQWIVFALYCISAIAVSITGFYGGVLVYQYMMPL